MRNRFWIIITLALIICNTAGAEDRTVGTIINQPGISDGLTLFGPQGSDTTYLVDADGLLVHSWVSLNQPGQSVYLLEDGHLLRTENPAPGPAADFNAGGAGGRVVELDWDGTLLWEYDCMSATERSHHDVERLPNGNLLIIAWELKSSAETIAAGRNPSLLNDGELWPDHLLEVAPTGSSGGTVVWQWHVWDHMVQDYDSSKANYAVVAEHPELIDINYTGGPAGADWNHVNSIDYNPDLDQILVSSRTFSEIWVIDHSTTTAEAASHSGGNSGHGGDLLYRWGNPRVWDAGTTADQQLFGQHDAQWIGNGLNGAGNILIFNNGQGRTGGNYSSVDEIETLLDNDGNYLRTNGEAFGPAAPEWTYIDPVPTDLYASHVSGTQRLTNGNTLLCDGPNGTFIEVTSAGDVAWTYINPVTSSGLVTQGDAVPTNQQGQANSVFRAVRYSFDFAAFDGRDLTPGEPIELYGQAPTAAFSVLTPDPSAGEAVQLVDGSTGFPTTYSWDFGDGSSSSLAQTSHTWTQAGSYTVQLSVSNPAGSHSTSAVVEVAAGDAIFIDGFDDGSTAAWSE